MKKLLAGVALALLGIQENEAMSESELIIRYSRAEYELRELLKKSCEYEITDDEIRNYLQKNQGYYAFPETFSHAYPSNTSERQRQCIDNLYSRILQAEVIE